MATNLVVGIDVGLSGAFAALRADGSIEGLYEMPTIPVRKGKRQTHEYDASLLARQFQEYHEKFGAIFATEAVHPFYKASSASSFIFGGGLWLVRGVCATLSAVLHLIEPKDWKAEFNLLKKGKDDSRAVAARIWPKENFAKKKDDGRAEAALIAMYALRKLVIRDESTRNHNKAQTEGTDWLEENSVSRPAEP